jgi:hypothetical protein
MAAISEASPMWAPSGAHETVLQRSCCQWMRMRPLAVTRKFSCSLGLVARRRSATGKIHPTRRLRWGGGSNSPWGSCHERPGSKSTGKPRCLLASEGLCLGLVPGHLQRRETDPARDAHDGRTRARTLRSPSPSPICPGTFPVPVPDLLKAGTRLECCEYPKGVEAYPEVWSHNRQLSWST